MGQLAPPTNKVLIFELFASATPIFARERRLEGKKFLVFIENEAACASVTRGPPQAKAASKLVYFARASIAMLNLALWVERVPTGGDPANAPSRGKRLGTPAIMGRDFGKEL